MCRTDLKRHVTPNSIIVKFGLVDKREMTKKERVSLCVCEGLYWLKGERERKREEKESKKNKD